MYCPATRYGSWCHACLVSCGFKQLNVLFGRTFITRVNCICAIIILPYLKRSITSRETMPVLLRFTSCWKYTIMYARHCIGPSCKRTHTPPLSLYFCIDQNTPATIISLHSQTRGPYMLSPFFSSPHLVVPFLLSSFAQPH